MLLYTFCECIQVLGSGTVYVFKKKKMFKRVNLEFILTNLNGFQLIILLTFLNIFLIE